MVLPNFLVIGALKAGTSSLYMYLRSHPEVFMPKVKEARFFHFDPDNPAHVRMTQKGFPVATIEEYAKLFSDVRDEKAIGEASPIYLHSSRACLRIKEVIPCVKLIAILRDPVDRMYSHYLMNVRSGREERPFVQAFEEEKENWWVQSSLYFKCLRRFYDLFPKEKIRVILFHDFTNRTMEILRELYEFLEVDHLFMPDISNRYNAGGLPKSRVLHRILSPQESVKSTLKSFLPSFLLRHLKKMKEKNLEKITVNPEERRRLIEFYRDDIHKLERLIQRDLSLWLL